MASGLNKVFLLGRLGNDPEVRYTTNGGAVANFNVATNESWTDKQGQKQERTEWHRVVFWGKPAEIIKQYLTKGRRLYIEGRLQTRSWEDKQGQKRYTTEIVGNDFMFLDSGDRGAAGRDAAPDALGGDFPAGAGGYVGGGAGRQEDHNQSSPDDDIPF